MGAAAVLSKDLEGSFQGPGRREVERIHRNDGDEAEKSSLPGFSKMSCNGFGRIAAWVLDAKRDSGRATLKYLHAHPEEDAMIHVVV